jgi:AraC-like DNA-binding protein
MRRAVSTGAVEMAGGKFETMSVLAPSVGILWRVIESYGMDPEPYFRAEGLEARWPIEPGTRLPYEVVDRIRARAAADSGDPCFGLRCARFVHPSQIGALGYAFLASTTLREAFEVMRRYIRVLNDQGEFRIAEEDGRITATLQVAQDSENMTVRDDGQVAYAVTLCRMNAGPEFDPSRVTFRHPEPDDPKPYRELFRCPVHFGAEANTLTITSEQADRPLPSANPMLAQMNERVVIQRLAKLDQDDIPNRVRAAIMEQLPSGKVTDESVADALHMTSRTLHRRLKAEGHSFRSMLKGVRQELAEHYINDDTLTLTEITFLLGFSEMSSFSRAYKNWTGVSPSRARSADD